MRPKAKTVRVTLTPEIAELLEAEVESGRFANVSEALRCAALNTFAEDPIAELHEAFSLLDESPDQPEPTSARIKGEIQRWRAGVDN